MSRPLIGITGRRWPSGRLSSMMPVAMKDVAADVHFSDYSSSVNQAGGLPVGLTRDADVAAMVERLDGLILSGGADIDPTRYGHEHDAKLGELEPTRDEWEFALFAEASRVGLPVLGICRGLQLVNVALGGTLNQNVELEDGEGHPQWGKPRDEPAHFVDIVEGSVLSQFHSGRIGVNSLHHQTIRDLAPSLKVGAVAFDGVIEGVELSEKPVLAVQWHPELLQQPDPVFHWLINEARSYREAR